MKQDRLQCDKREINENHVEIQAEKKIIGTRNNTTHHEEKKSYENVQCLK